jgi:hypothetical protein
VLSCCTSPDPINFPTDAVEVTPPVPYAQWWSLTEACAQRTVPFNSVRWFVEARPALLLGGESYGGYWFADGNRILLPAPSVYRGDVVRHEMLHAILQDGSHPRVEFVDHCGGVVAFGDPLHIEPSALLPGPGQNSPVLSPGDLQVVVDLVPAAPTSGLPDSGWVTILVTVTNPLAQAAWVRVHPFLTGQTLAQTFGYRLERSGSGPSSFDDYSGDSLVAFGPGETKRRAFDERLSPFPGTWSVRGFFSADTTAPRAFTLSP